MIPTDIDDHIGIYFEIVMNEHVPDAAYTGPGDFGTKRTEFFRQLPGCFTDDLEVAEHRIHPHRIGHEGFKINALQVCDDSLGMNDCVLEIEKVPTQLGAPLT